MMSENFKVTQHGKGRCRAGQQALRPPHLENSMKKKRLGNLKPGQKFRYKRKLYLYDSLYCPVHISTGNIGGPSNNVMVTPIKLSIRVK